MRLIFFILIDTLVDFIKKKKKIGIFLYSEFI